MKYLPEMQIDAPKPRWTPGSLAEACGNGTRVGNTRADAVEELINSAEALTSALQPTGKTRDANEVMILLRALQRLGAAVSRAKNWSHK